jgi:hypothetical protein
MAELEQIVQLEHEGRRFTFRIDRDSPLSFWRIECDGRVYPAPLRVRGDEPPEFFRKLVRTAIEQGEL